MNQFFLAKSGSLSLDDLARVLGDVPALLHVPDIATVRTVAFQNTDGEWISFASHFAIGIGDQQSSKTLYDVGLLRLIHVVGKVSEIASSENLQKFLATWRPIVGAESRSIGFQSRVDFFRESSDSQLCKDPAWRANLHYTFTSTSHNIPSGPFFNPHYGFFALDIGDAAAQWLAIPFLSSQSSVQNHVNLLLPDRRAFIGDIVREGTEIIVQAISNIHEDLFCTLSTTDYDGNRHHFNSKVLQGTAKIPFPVLPKTIHLFLMGAGGFCYDEYYEDEYRRTRAKSLLSSERKFSDQAYKGLLEALEAGENERTEFKEWVPTDRNEKKSYELLKVACAFANSTGGVLYIGITDELEIKGLRRHLANYGVRTGCTFDKKRSEYVQDVKRIIGEGISPMLDTDIEWITHSNNYILKINIPYGKNGPYQIVESHEIFVRRGGSCTKASVSELELLFQREKPQNVQIDKLFRS
jgi:hypothetical protein